jgi:thymidine phosphorylase
VRDLTNALQQTIGEQVEVSKPCPFMKRQWNSDLRDLKLKLNKLSVETTRQRAMPNHSCHEARRHAAGDYSKVIVAAKEHWTDFLEEALKRDL